MRGSGFCLRRLSCAEWCSKRQNQEGLEYAKLKQEVREARQRHQVAAYARLGLPGARRQQSRALPPLQSRG